MSYIVPMEKPKRCGLCPCFHAEHPMHCQAVKAHKDKRIIAPYGAPIPDWCPLIELPPHGRLIDADKFEFEMNDKLLVALTEKYGEEEAQKGLHFSFRDCISNIQFQPTVIEAERSETE